MKYIIPLVFFLASCTGERPTNLGVTEGKLADCPDKPNCVSSYSTDEEHQIAPLEASLQEIKKSLSQQERVKIIIEKDNYLYAEFTSRVMRFVDDVEFFAIPEMQVIHVRSASRIGKSDLGVNRKRIEAIRASLNE
ncbi:MAG: hypothetical protein COB67_03780 [SAR324 cluster bacterium]|uniref:DUF1499 domain-containing protein n=1 Tax=SAR324 cluster bacterium TaxID=2024889 RepID=A0A2A4T904_9DELT|nr:MAG: hypothetical protein COB67_03780 [SAR324 cluster bacterium]